MQINNVSVNYNQNYPNFKALKSIKFCDELEINTRAKNELLKIFEHQPIKDLFTKFDAEVNFESKIFNNIEDVTNNEKIYKIECNINLISKKIDNLVHHFRKEATIAGVNIDHSIDNVLQKYKNSSINFSAFSNKEERYDLKMKSIEIEDLQKQIDIEKNSALHITKQIQELNKLQSNNQSDVEDRQELKRRHQVRLGTIENLTDRLNQEKDKFAYHKQFENIIKNPFAIAARKLANHIQTFNSEKIYKDNPKLSALDENFEEKLNEVLEDAIIDKNVEIRLKELLGENYIAPEERVRMVIEENFKKNIDKSAFETQYKTEEKVSNAKRKTRKPKTKKADVE